MNTRKLTDSELLDLINSTDNIDILALAELEYINRHTKPDRWEITDNDIDEEIMKEINATWRAN